MTAIAKERAKILPEHFEENIAKLLSARTDNPQQLPEHIDAIVEHLKRVIAETSGQSF